MLLRKFFYSIIFLLVINIIINNNNFVLSGKNQAKKFRSRGIIIPRSFTLATNYFGLNLLAQLNGYQDQQKRKTENEEEFPTDNVRKNILISPLSITSSLVMLYLATPSDDQLTANQIEKILGFNLAWPINGQPDRDHIRESIRKTMIKSSELKTIRTVMANQTLRLNLDYARMIQDYFNAEIIINQDPELNGLIPMPDQNKTYVGRIWQRNIPGSAEIQSSNGIGLLDYAIFHGVWQYRFDVANTRPGMFIGANRVFYENVPFMRMRAPVPVVPMDEIDAAMVELPFKDGPFAMYAILPARTTDDLSLIRRSLNPWYLESTIRRLERYGRIMVEFPTFGIEAIMDLRSPLQRMGLTELFQPDRARLDSLASDGIYLKDFRHKVRMEVRESGVGAMDNDGPEIATGKKPKRIDPNSSASLAFDHPFLYFIRHIRTGAIVLIGEIHGF